MSLSGSAAEDFQKTGDGVLHYGNEPKAPEATPENPGAVHPQVYGGPAEAGTMPGSGTPDHHGDVRGVFSNPLKAREVFSDLSTAFTTAINAVKDESGSGIGNVGRALIAKLESMRDEVDGWSAGRGLPEAGSTDKTSEVKRVGEGGLYKD